MTAKIKLNAASGGGSVSIQAPSSSSNNRVYTLPDTAHISTLGGISECDQWYLTSDVTTNNANLTSWSRYTQASVSAASPLGTGMSHSSGTFTFSSTGKYLVILNASLLLVQNDNLLIDTNVTIDNSTYVPYANAKDGNSASDTIAGSGCSFAFIDVTNTSNIKVQFYAKSIASGSSVLGYDSSNGIGTSALFVRIGDT